MSTPVPSAETMKRLPTTTPYLLRPPPPLVDFLVDHAVAFLAACRLAAVSRPRVRSARSSTMRGPSAPAAPASIDHLEVDALARRIVVGGLGLRDHQGRRRRSVPPFWRSARQPRERLWNERLDLVDRERLDAPCRRTTRFRAWPSPLPSACWGRRSSARRPSSCPLPSIFLAELLQLAQAAWSRFVGDLRRARSTAKHAPRPSSRPSLPIDVMKADHHVEHDGAEDHHHEVGDRLLLGRPSSASECRGTSRRCRRGRRSPRRSIRGRE